jgi:hypothetical protein
MYLFLKNKPILDPPSYPTHRSSFEAKVSLIRPEEPSFFFISPMAYGLFPRRSFHTAGSLPREWLTLELIPARSLT